MCGIVGGFGIGKVDVAKMNAELAHRGPDQKGEYMDDHLALGHRRLSIIDLSEKGRQPFTNDEGTLQLVYNGEVYNFRELRRRLEKKGARFRSQTDTEVILRGYELKGKEFFEELDGMYAFALWDAERHRLILHRDRFGIKPLYVYESKGKDVFAFSSEVKAFAKHPDIKLEPDLEALSEFVQLRFSLGAKTVFKNIWRILPGEILEITPGLKRTSHILGLAHDERPALSDETAAKELRSALDDEVNAELVADVPVGIFLSGGLDSSAIAKSVAKGTKVSTFSVAMGEDNELEFCKQVAESIGSDHHEIWLDIDLFKVLPECVWHLEEPQPDETDPAVLELSKATRKKGIIVALAGEGADEMFSSYAHEQMLAKIARVPGPLRKMGSCFAEAVPNALLQPFFNYPGKVGSLAKKKLAAVLRTWPSRNALLEAMRIFEEQEVRELGLPASKLAFAGEFIGKRLDREFLRADLSAFLPNYQLLRTDKLGMAASLEVRVPYLSRRVFGCAWALTPGQKTRGGVEKWIVRKAFADLPPAVVKRRKRPFVTPFFKWCEKQFLEYAAARIEEPSDILKKESCRKIYEKYAQDQLFRGRQLLTICIIKEWEKLFFR